MAFKMTLLQKIEFMAKIYQSDVDELDLKIEKLKSRRKEKIVALENLSIIISEEKKSAALTTDS